MNDKLTNALIEALTSNSNEIKTISSNSDKKLQNLAQLAYEGYMWIDTDISDDNNYEKLIIDMSDIMDNDLSEEDNEKAHQILLDLFEQNGWEVYTEGGAYPWNGQIITVNPYTAIAIRENKIEESIKVTEGNLYNYEYIIYRQRATKAPLYVKDYSTETENISEAVAFPTQKEAEEYKEELELEHKEQYKIGIKNNRKDENKELTESKETDKVQDLLEIGDELTEDLYNEMLNYGPAISGTKVDVYEELKNVGHSSLLTPELKDTIESIKAETVHIFMIAMQSQSKVDGCDTIIVGTDKDNKIVDKKLFTMDSKTVEENKDKKVEAVEYISKAEYDKLPADYKTTIAQTLKARQAVGDNVEELRKLYKDLGYDEEDPMIMANEKGGTILKPVKIQESENELRHQELNNNIVDNSFDIDDMEKRLDKTSINENKTEKCEITETIINKLNEAYSSNNNVSDNKEDGFTYAKILVDFFDDIDYEKWNEEQDTSKREDMVRPNMKAFVDRYGKELINRPNTIQGMFDYLEDWNYHTQYGVLKQELDKFMQDNDTKLTESSKLEDYWDATIVAKDGFMTLLKFNFGSDLHHNNYIITVDANDVKRFYANNDKEAISIYEQFKTEWQNSDHVSADLNVQPLVTENNSNATLNQSNMKSDKTTLTNNENGLKVPNKLNETNTQRYTVYIIEEPNEDCSPYTIYDNECDDFYFDENGFNPVFDTETETEQYIKENLIK